MKQVTSGKAFEYGIVSQLEELIFAEIVDNEFVKTAELHFDKCDEDEREKIIRASREIVAFLISKDSRFESNKCAVRMQSDQAGGRGDVRDVIIESPYGEIGISAKNRNFA